jgi:hypothetical protein
MAADDHALASGLDGLKTVHAYLGHTDALTTVVDELEPMLRRQGDLLRLQHAVFESAFVPLAAGDWDQVIAGMESAIEINRRSGFPHWAAGYVAHLAWLARLRGQKAMWDLAGALVPRRRSYDYNQALMDFGATWCTARAPRCRPCPMKRFCATYRVAGG